MPDIDLKSTTALLFATAFVGFGTVVGAAFLVGLPGIATRYLLDEASIDFDGWALAIVALPGTVFLLLAALRIAWVDYFPQVTVNLLLSAVLLAALFCAGGRAFWLSRKSSLTAKHFMWSSFGGRLCSLWVSAFLWLLGTLMALGFGFWFAKDSPHQDWLAGAPRPTPATSSGRAVRCSAGRTTPSPAWAWAAPSRTCGCSTR
jgi:hypothetical protein